MATRPHIRPKIASPNRRQVLLFVDVFSETAKAEGPKMSEVLAKDVVHTAREALDKQLFNWPVLSKGHLDKKKREGLDLRMLLATKYYRDNIMWWKDSKGNIHVGVRPGAIHKPSGMPLKKLARIHEYGSRKMQIPARQLWRPVWSMVLARRRKHKQAYYINTFRRLRKAGYRIGR